MAFDLTAGNVKFTFESLDSGSLVDQTLLPYIERDSFASSADATAFFGLFTSTDKNKCRFCKGDGITELAFDIIDIDLTTGSEYVQVAILWSGTLTSTGTYSFYFMPALSGNTSYGASSTYGQYNAYDDDYVHSHPLGDYNDRTSAQLNGTVVGTPTSATGQLGDGLDFGGDSSLEMGEQSPGMEEEYTISMWVKLPADYSSYGGLVNFSSSFGNGIQTRVNSSGVVYIRYWSGGFEAITGTVDLADNDFHMVSFRFNKTDGTRLYIDGVLDGTNTDILDIANLTDQEFEIATYGGSNALDGVLNQVQSHKVDRGADWLAYEYDMTSDNATWLGTGTYTAPSGGGSADGELALTQAQTFGLTAIVTTYASLALTQEQTFEVSGFNSMEGALSLTQAQELDLTASAGTFVEGALNLIQAQEFELLGEAVTGVTGQLALDSVQEFSLTARTTKYVSIALTQEQEFSLTGSGGDPAVGEVGLNAFFNFFVGNR